MAFASARMRSSLYGLLMLSVWTGGLLFAAEVRGQQVTLIGSEAFTNHVGQSLRLLEQKAPSAYTTVTNYVKRIRQGQHSGMWAYETPPTYEMSDTTAFYSLTWCAATIAHDAFHSKLYHDYRSAHGTPVPNAIWTGLQAEQACMKHQLAVMKAIGSPTNEVTHAEQQADGHYVKDHETWEDFRKNRKW